MTLVSNSASRALSILDILDEKEEISAQILLDHGASRSTVYRDLAVLVEAGLLARLQRGFYRAGPRYVRQPPGTRFDRAHRTKQMIEDIRRLRHPAEGSPMTIANIARELGTSVSTVRKLIRQNQ